MKELFIFCLSLCCCIQCIYSIYQYPCQAPAIVLREGEKKNQKCINVSGFETLDVLSNTFVKVPM